MPFLAGFRDLADGWALYRGREYDGLEAGGDAEARGSCSNRPMMTQVKPRSMRRSAAAVNHRRISDS